MTSLALRLGAFAIAAAALTACGGGSVNVVTPPGPTPTLADKFGTGFGTDFAAPANSQPAKPMASDIIPLSLTAQPTPLH